MNTTYQRINTQGAPIKAWTRGVPVEDDAVAQLTRVAQLPFIHGWVAVMPDVHVGKGATVGSVIPTVGAIIPAAVGVDIGCGMVAVRTTLSASDLPDDLKAIRSLIEARVPHGRTHNGGPGDRGAWAHPAGATVTAWDALRADYGKIAARHPRIGRGVSIEHLGTLGTGNHFIELCLDEGDHIWVMLHSGSRGVGNRVGSHFIELAKEDMRRWFINLPDQDLAYLAEGTEHFADYVEAVGWAQRYAAVSRQLMVDAVLDVLRVVPTLPPFDVVGTAVNCHHNYISREHHLGANVWVTRKGAVSARDGEWGIIPGSMGARSFIVRGKGNDESFHSCSHGAGRKHSRTMAKKMFTLEDHARATAHVECRKDEDVVDETPAAYKSIDDVMAAQSDLVEIVHTLRQVVCVKG